MLWRQVTHRHWAVARTTITDADADAEDVGKWPARGDSERVPERGQPRVLQDPGVGELVRCLLDAGRAQGGCVGRQRGLSHC